MPSVINCKSELFLFVQKELRRGCDKRSFGRSLQLSDGSRLWVMKTSPGCSLLGADFSTLSAFWFKLNLPKGVPTVKSPSQ